MSLGRPTAAHSLLLTYPCLHNLQRLSRSVCSRTRTERSARSPTTLSIIMAYPSPQTALRWLRCSSSRRKRSILCPHLVVVLDRSSLGSHVRENCTVSTWRLMDSCCSRRVSVCYGCTPMVLAS